MGRAGSGPEFHVNFGQWRFCGFHFGGGTGVATLSSGGGTQLILSC